MLRCKINICRRISIKTWDFVTHLSLVGPNFKLFPLFYTRPLEKQGSQVLSFSTGSPLSINQDDLNFLYEPNWNYGWSKIPVATKVVTSAAFFNASIFASMTIEKALLTSPVNLMTLVCLENKIKVNFKVCKCKLVNHILVHMVLKLNEKWTKNLMRPTTTGAAGTGEKSMAAAGEDTLAGVPTGLVMSRWEQG